MGSVEMKYNDKNMGISGTAVNAPGDEYVIWTDSAGAAQPVSSEMAGRHWHIAQNLNCVSQGQSAKQRIGRKWTVKSILLNLGLTFDFYQGRKGSVSGRIVLIWDKQCNGTIVKGDDIFDPLGSVGDLIGDTTPGLPFINALPNIANNQRFKILVDKTYNWTMPDWSLAPETIGGNNVYGSFFDRQIKLYKKLNLDIESSTTDGSVGGIRSNNLILAMCFNATDGTTTNIEPSAATSSFGVIPSGICRIRFSDM